MALASRLSRRGGKAMSTDKPEPRVTVGVEELALSNSITLTALVELLEERGLVKRDEVLKRTQEIRDRKKPN
jgi:hypothetical protein